MARDAMDLLQGTLDVLILRTLAWGPMHGYAVSRWIRERTDGTLDDRGRTAVQGTAPAREAARCVRAEWGLSENNRRARFYRLTAARAPAAAGARRRRGAAMRRGVPGARARAMRRIVSRPSRDRDQIRRDVDEELRFHLDARTDELVAQGHVTREAAPAGRARVRRPR